MSLATFSLCVSGRVMSKKTANCLSPKRISPQGELTPDGK